MRIHVKLFATLIRYRSGGQAGTPFEVELPEGAALQDLITCLKIPPKETRITFINGVVQSPDRILKQGDEVGIFPPIGGG
ncbi:MAG: MoaD/ThiS family protein [Chloroflexi bacterium]|nr:MoaD/ThiS family protein [Chloroflexota bacterium]